MNSIITIRTDSFYQFQEGGTIMDMSLVLLVAMGFLTSVAVAGRFQTVTAVVRRRTNGKSTRR